MHEKAKRNSLIDFYKGMLIIGVIWGHTITALRAGEGTPVWILTFFRTYDMPFFMLLSGYFLAVSMNKRPWKQVAVKRVRNILVPLLAWQVVFGLTGPLFASLKSMFSLWFLWSLIGCTAIVIAIRALVKYKTAAVMCDVIAVLAVHCSDKIPFNIGYMLFFFVLGYHLQQLLKKIPARLIVPGSFFVGSAFIVMQCFWSGEYNVWNAGTNVLQDSGRMIGIVVFRDMIGICGCVAMKKLFDVLYGQFGRAADFVVRAGRETMLLYILQSMLIEKILAKVVSLMARAMGGNPLVFNMPLLGYVIAPAITIAVIAVMMWSISIIRRIHVVSDIFTGFPACSAKAVGGER